jgi:hypothetical protein
MMAINLASTIHLIADVQRRCGRWDRRAPRVVEETGSAWLRRGHQPARRGDAPAIYLDLGRPDLAHRHIEAFAPPRARHACASERRLAGRLPWLSAVDRDEQAWPALASENLLLGCAHAYRRQS